MSRLIPRACTNPRLKQPWRLHPVHAPVAQITSQGGDQLAPPCASNSNLNIAKLYLPHQHMPTGRLPGPHQPHPRPLVSLPVKRQAHEIERRWRRSPFDCGGPERRGSPRRLKLPPHGQHAEAAMRFAHPEPLRANRRQGCPSRLSAQQSRQSGRPGLNLRFSWPPRETRRSRLAAAVEVSPVCAIGTSSPARHVSRVKKSVTRSSFLESALALEDRHPSPAPSFEASSSSGGNLDRDRQVGGRRE